MMELKLAAIYSPDGIDVSAKLYLKSHFSEVGILKI